MIELIAVLLGYLAIGVLVDAFGDGFNGPPSKDRSSQLAISAFVTIFWLPVMVCMLLRRAGIRAGQAFKRKEEQVQHDNPNR